MIEQEKQLLLADLCARLPYNVRIRHYVNDIDFYSNPLMTYDIDQLENNKAIIKPYLRPMLSMSDGEKKEFHHVASLQRNYLGDDMFYTHWQMYDWLNAHHFDYRGLISKGLAERATEEMYK